jgi:DNA-nicking Smr family endonuclease
MKDAPPIVSTPGRSRLRRLSDDEIALWLTVTKSVTPRPDAVLPAPPNPAPAAPAPPPPTQNAAQQMPAEPARGTLLPRLAPLDRRLRQRLTRGQTDVDAVIDLHGLNQQEAHAALHRFLLRAQGNGAKLALVVTGKGESHRAEDGGGNHYGGNNYGGMGVLRRLVPLWLKAPDWRGLVVGFEEASKPHGGAGALYVRLRRRDRLDR